MGRQMEANCDMGHKNVLKHRVEVSLSVINLLSPSFGEAMRELFKEHEDTTKGKVVNFYSSLKEQLRFCFTSIPSFIFLVLYIHNTSLIVGSHNCRKPVHLFFCSPVFIFLSNFFRALFFWLYLDFAS